MIGFKKTSNGVDIHMMSVTNGGCGRNLDGWYLSDCMANCDKCYSCDYVDIANELKENLKIELALAK